MGNLPAAIRFLLLVIAPAAAAWGQALPPCPCYGHVVVGPQPPCDPTACETCKVHTVSISPDVFDFPASGGMGTASVTMGDKCYWPLEVGITHRGCFVKVNSYPEGGSGTFSFTVPLNPTSSSRTCYLSYYNVASMEVTEAAGCGAPKISPTAQQNFPAAGGTGSIAVTSGTGCPWAAVSNQPWVTITSGASGSGNGTIQYSVAANTGDVRDATISVSGAELKIQQGYPVQFVAQGTQANGSRSAAGVVAGLAVDFSGWGWNPAGGNVTVTFSNNVPSQTFTPVVIAGSTLSFAGSLGALSFLSQTTPPCTVLITAAQGSTTASATLTGVYLGKYVVPNAGNQICQSTQYPTLDAYVATLQGAPFTVIESATTEVGGSLVYVFGAPTVSLGAGVLIDPGQNFSFPGPDGVFSVSGDATTPIAGSFFSPPSGAQVVTPPPRGLSGMVAGLVDVTGDLSQPSGLPLDNALLYIQGNANVYQGISGYGTVIATGAINVTGPVKLTSSGDAALASEANITIQSATVTCATLDAIRAAIASGPGGGGVSLGQPGYNPALDLNGDGEINVYDLALAAQQLPDGTMCQ